MKKLNVIQLLALIALTVTAIGCQKEQTTKSNTQSNYNSSADSGFVGFQMRWHSTNAAIAPGSTITINNTILLSKSYNDAVNNIYTYKYQWTWSGNYSYMDSTKTYKPFKIYKGNYYCKWTAEIIGTSDQCLGYNLINCKKDTIAPYVLDVMYGKNTGATLTMECLY